MKNEPKVFKIEGEAFARIKALKEKQIALVNAAREGEKAMQDAVMKEIGIVPGTIGNPFEFDEQYESTGVYFVRELMPHPLAMIMRAMHASVDGEECPICHEVHGKDDVTKH